MDGKENAPFQNIKAKDSPATANLGSSREVFQIVMDVFRRASTPEDKAKLNSALAICGNNLNPSVTSTTTTAMENASKDKDTPAPPKKENSEAVQDLAGSSFKLPGKLPIVLLL